MTARGSTVRAVLVGGAVVLTSSLAMLLGAGALTDWRPPPTLGALDPGPSPDLAPGPVHPISSEHVAIDAGDRSIDGTVTAPQVGARVGVVLVAGSGPSDRDGMLPLAESLARAGVAVLTYDKRTEGYSPVSRDLEALADDAVSAVEALRSTGVDRVGVLGVSEGGWVASIAAGRTDSPVDLVVLASAPVVSPLEQVSWIVDTALATSPEAVRRAAATGLAGGRVVVDYLDVDPLDDLAASGVPVLAVWGADDTAVPVNEAYRRLRSVLRDRLAAHVVPNAGHDVVDDVTAWLPAATRWMERPHGSDPTGAEPATAAGVPRPPASIWINDPRVHLALSLALGAATAIAVRRRTTRRLERPHPCRTPSS